MGHDHYVPRQAAEAGTARRYGSAEVAEVAQCLRSTSVLLAGRPGVGKSRLVTEVVARLGIEPAAQVSATVSTSRIPFAAVCDLIPIEANGSSWPELRRSVDQRFPANRQNPPVVLIDNINLLDDSSAALVLHLVETGRVRVLATLRVGVAAPDAVLALWKDGRAERLPVTGFTESGTRRYAEWNLGGPVSAWLACWLYHRTKGNPLLLRESLRAATADETIREDDGLFVLDGVPAPGERFVDLVRPQLESLPTEEREALELIALAEPLRWEPALAAVGQQILSALERRGDIIVESSDAGLSVRARHPLLADLIGAELPTGIRAVRRNRLATAILGGQPTRAEHLRVINWRVEDGHAVDLPDLFDAAETACRLGLAGEATRLARAARAQGGGARATFLAAHSQLISGDPHMVIELLEELPIEALASASGGAALRLRVAAEVRAGPVEELQAFLDGPAVQHLDERFIAAARVTLLANAGEYPEAVRLARTISHSGSGQAAAFLGTPLAWASLHRGAGAVALEVAGEAPREGVSGEPARHRFESWAAVRVEGMLDWDQVDGQALTTLASAVRTGDRALAGSVTAYLGRLALLRGRPGRAELYLLEARNHLQSADPGGVIGLIEAWLVTARARLGKVDEAGLARATRQLGSATGWLRHSGALPHAGAWLAAARGDLRAARQIALTGARAMASRSVLDEATLLHDALRFGDRDPAIRSRLCELAEDSDLPAISLRARHAELLEDPDGLLGLSLDLEAVGATLWAAEAAADAAVAVRARDGSSGTGRLFARSRLLADRCEGASTPALGWRTMAPLTERQLEVVELAARGHSSPQIAEALTLSARTVESHLFRAMKRLGVNRRSDLATTLPQPVPATDPRQVQ